MSGYFDPVIGAYDKSSLESRMDPKALRRANMTADLMKELRDPNNMMFSKLATAANLMYQSFDPNFRGTYDITEEGRKSMEENDIAYLDPTKARLQQKLMKKQARIDEMRNQGRGDAADRLEARTRRYYNLDGKKGLTDQFSDLHYQVAGSQLSSSNVNQETGTLAETPEQLSQKEVVRKQIEESPIVPDVTPNLPPTKGELPYYMQDPMFVAKHGGEIPKYPNGGSIDFWNQAGQALQDQLDPEAARQRALRENQGTIDYFTGMQEAGMGVGSAQPQVITTHTGMGMPDTNLESVQEPYQRNIPDETSPGEETIDPVTGQRIQLKPGFDGRMLAGGIEMGIGAINSFMDAQEAARRENELMAQTSWVNMAKAVPEDESSLKGDYDPNTGRFRPNQQGTTYGMTGKIAAYGGEIDKMESGGTVKMESVYNDKMNQIKNSDLPLLKKRKYAMDLKGRYTKYLDEGGPAEFDEQNVAEDFKDKINLAFDVIKYDSFEEGSTDSFERVEEVKNQFLTNVKKEGIQANVKNIIQSNNLEDEKSIEK